MKKHIFITVLAIVLLWSPFLATCLPVFDFEAEDHDIIKSPIKSVTPDLEKGKFIALTFDDGPTAVTWQILDELAKYDARATFFVLGHRLVDYPETIMRIINEGHQIGNHSYSHKQLNAISAKELHNELDKANDAIFKATGVTPTILRPPFGAFNKKVVEAAKARGMAIIHWSIDPVDWTETASAAKVSQRIIKNAKEGDIILMHDLYPQSGQAAAIVLKELTERGFTFVTVDELIAYYSEKVTPGVVYENAIKRINVAYE